MSRKVLILAVLVLTCTRVATGAGNTAETKPSDHCTFCDTWQPYDSRGTTFSSDEVLVITRDTLALPGCSPVKARIVEQGFDKYHLDDPGIPLAIRLLYKLEEDPKCKRPMPLVRGLSLVKVCVEQPQFGPGSERMEVSIVQTTDRTEAHRASGDTKWSLIRSDYNPGDEGSGWGARIVGGIAHLKAEERMNKEWRRLLKLGDEKRREDWKQRQSMWLPSITCDCDKDRGGLPYWNVAYRELCIAGALDRRTREFQNLRKCFLEGKNSCPELAMNYPDVGRGEEENEEK